MSKIKIEIKNRWTGSVLFEYEKENNTVKDTMEEAIKEGAYLREANLEGAYLREANLEGANLEGANLREAYLEGANLREANLEGAYLREANLEGANLEGAYLREAYLEGANLEGANLRGTDLGEAYLREADLEGADLEGAYTYLGDNEIDIESVVKDFEEKNNIKITEWYINRNVIPTRWNCFWRYGLIICDYEIAKSIKKMTTEEAEKELSEKYGCEVKLES